MTDFRIRVVVDPSGAVRGARTANAQLHSIGAAATRVQRLIAGAFAFGSIGFGLRALAQAADAVTTLENRMKLLTSGSATLEAQMESLFNVANRTRTSFRATGTIYSRVGLAAKELGVGQDQLLRFTESLNQAVILSGSTAREAEFALIQLSQGIASGVLRGDELRSVLEQLPFVADVIAKSLGVTRGELRQLGADGKISAKQILDAFEGAGADIAELFAQTTPTIAQSFIVLRNEATRLVGALDDSFNNASGALAETVLAAANALTFLADNADLVVAALQGIAAIGLARLLAPYVQSVKQAVVASVAFNASVRAGDAVALGSAEANRQRAQSSLAASQADLKSAISARTKTASTLESLRANQALIISQLARARSEVELQKGIAASTGATSALVKAQASVAASRKALIVTNRALAASERELAAASLQVSKATDANTAAFRSFSTATVAASTPLAVLARTFPGIAAGITSIGLALKNVALFALANPLTALLTAAAAVNILLSVTEQRSERIARLNETVENSVQAIRTAYEAVRGEVDQVAESVKNISLTETLRTAQSASTEAVRSLGLLGFETEQTVKNLRGAFGTLPASIRVAGAEITRLKDQLEKEGAAGLEAFSEGLDRVGAGLSGRNQKAIAGLLEAVRETQTLVETAAKAEAAVRVLEGTATDADLALLELSTRDLSPVAQSVIPITKEVKEAADAISRLKGAIDGVTLSNVGLAAQNAALLAGESIAQSEATARIAEERARLAVALASEEGAIRAAAAIELQKFVDQQQRGVGLSEQNKALLDAAAQAARELAAAANGAGSELGVAAANAALVAQNLNAAAAAIGAVSSAAASLDISAIGVEAQNAALRKGEDSISANAAGRVAQERARLSSAFGSGDAAIRAAAQKTLDDYTAAVDRNSAAQRANIELIKAANAASSGGGSGSSGGGGGTSVDRAAELQAVNDQLALEAENLTKSASVRQAENQLRSITQSLQRKGIELSALEIQDIENRIAANQQLEQSMQFVQSVGEALFGGLDDAVADFIRTGEFNFQEFATNVVADLARIATQILLIQPLMEGLASFAKGNGFTFNQPNLGGLFKGILGFQNGGTVVKGSGGPDSQLFVAKVSPGERIDFTPEGSGPSFAQRIPSPAEKVDALQDGISRNRAQVPLAVDRFIEQNRDNTNVFEKFERMSARAPGFQNGGAVVAGQSGDFHLSMADRQFGMTERVVDAGNFQSGGTVIGGSGGPDSQLFVSRVSPGERVDFTPEGNGGSGGGGREITINYNISTPDVEGFRRSQSQIAASAARLIGTGQRNL